MSSDVRGTAYVTCVKGKCMRWGWLRRCRRRSVLVVGPDDDKDEMLEQELSSDPGKRLKEPSAWAPAYSARSNEGPLRISERSRPRGRSTTNLFGREGGRGGAQIGANGWDIG